MKRLSLALMALVAVMVFPHEATKAAPAPVDGLWDAVIVAAGTDVLAQENIEEVLPLPEDFTGDGELFMLRVRGDSMIEAGILEGDTVLIKKTEAADTGDIVVALIDEEEATLKRFRRRGASIALEPANAAYEVRILPPNRVRIQGKLIGLYRKY